MHGSRGGYPRKMIRVNEIGQQTSYPDTMHYRQVIGLTARLEPVERVKLIVAKVYETK
jgi:hypothetical protein